GSTAKIAVESRRRSGRRSRRRAALRSSSRGPRSERARPRRRGPPRRTASRSALRRSSARRRRRDGRSSQRSTFRTRRVDISRSGRKRSAATAPGAPIDFAGRTLHFGVREHGMGAIVNGMALHGAFLPFGATFLIFSDYMRPPIRLAALSGIQSLFVFTHDSVFLGEDGPTHQPVEQLASLRLIPNIEVWRPADGPETAAAWASALRRSQGPSALALTRQKLHPLARAGGAGLEPI